MEENYKISYSLYLYNTGSLKIFPGASHRKQYSSEGEAIKSARLHFENLKKVYTNDEKYNTYFGKKQILVVKYTNSFESHIVGILENCAKTYTKIPGTINPEILKTRMV